MRARTPRSTRRCRRWAGGAPTVPAIWCGWKAQGLIFCGRADDQVKVGGRRIELGEVDAALVHLPGVSGGAAAVRRTAAGTPVLVGYVASTDPEFDIAAARAQLAAQLPAALVPRLVRLDELPTRTSGKVDRDALPWPPPGGGDAERTPELSGTAQLVGRAVAGPAGRHGDGSRGRFLRARRRLAGRRAARFRTARSVSPGHRRRPVRPSPAGVAGRLSRRARDTAGGDRAGGATDPTTDAACTDRAVGPVGHVGRAAMGDVVGAGQQRRPRITPGPLDRRSELVAGCGRVRRIRHAAGPDGDRSAGSAAVAAEGAAGDLPSRRVGAPAGVAGRAACRSQRGRELSRSAVAGVLRAGTGRRYRQGCRSALDAAGHRAVDTRASERCRARSGPVRALDRRRRLPRRRDLDRQRRHDRRAHHAAARSRRRQERRRGSRLGRRRESQKPPVLERIARGEIRSGQAPVARRTAGAQIPLGRGVRPDVDAARGYATDRSGGGARR